MTKVIPLLVLICCMMAVSSEVNAQQNDFEKWKKGNSQEFKRYLSEQDKAFAGFLSQKWIKKTVTLDDIPSEKKIPKAPVAPKSPASPLAEPKQQKAKVKITPNLPESKPQSRNENLQEPPKVSSGQFIFSFLGHKLKMPKPKLEPLTVSRPNSDAIADAWVKMSQNHDNNLVEAIKLQAEGLNLDDWGRAILTYDYLLQGLTPNLGNRTNSQLILHTWYYLVKQGLNVRVAYDEQSVYLLLNTNLPLYAQKYFNLAGHKFYFVDFSGAELPKLNKVYTYQTQHEQGSAALEIDLAKMPRLNRNNTQRQFSFDYQQRSYSLSVNYHIEYIEFLSKYPQLDVKHYFVTELNETTKYSLLSPLSEMLKGRSEVDALNFLLRFVQKGLAYKTDDQQFNEENFMFTTEALHYPFADCEDRSVLYSYLVKELLGNKIIGVLYKGHIATAVKLSTDFNGANYKVAGEKFYIADPTYIGANLGDVMPGYESQSPRLIKVN
ncbi:MAG: hypothetical protein HWE10_04525 [Gammaproteobacteria bacterium]|nr:hypothetical protein [Gammaproteobacteria bacterium]